MSPRSLLAFAAPAAPASALSNFHATPICQSHNPTPQPQFSTTRTTPRMEAASTQVPAATTSKLPLGAFSSWPPAEMTPEWAEAVERLSTSISGCTLSEADDALEAAEGDEMLALRYLTEESKSEIQRQREQVVQAAREAGDLRRVSAVKEAELRRRATGSARDFFKGYVETEGQYVDQGYVDENADAMGKFMGKIKGLFGGK